MTEHWIVLAVVIPLLASPVCLLLPNGRAPWLWTTAVSWVAFGVVIALLQSVLSTGVISYELGGWEPPWGIEYRVDTLGAFVMLIVAGISAVVLPFAALSVENEVSRHRLSLFYTAYLLCLAGLLGIAATGDAFNVFVFLEISSLSAYTLIALGRPRKALTASYQYLIMGTIGATFIVIGIGLMYMMTGTLNMVDLAQRLPAVEATRTVHTAFAFFIVGVSLKLALFPLHLWLPNAYAYAPSAVTAFMASTATKVAVYLMLRFVFNIFGQTYSFEELHLAEVFLVLAVAGIFSGSAVAIFQNNVKRMLAYSSVAQIGYMILAISFATATGLTAGVLHLFNHAIAKGTLFLALGCVAYRISSARFQDMAGIGRQMPWTMLAFIVGGISLIGVPTTAGFISKWYLLSASLELRWWPIAALIVVASLMAVFYVWRVVENVFFQPAPERDFEVREAPLALLVPTWVLALANFYFGLDTRWSVGLATRAASNLLGTDS